MRFAGWQNRVRACEPANWSPGSITSLAPTLSLVIYSLVFVSSAMGNWQLEVAEMAVYVFMPVAAFYAI